MSEKSSGDRSLRKVRFASAHEPLRREVSALGAMVGEIVREQCGEELYEHVEGARRAAIRRREGGGDAELVAAVERLDPAAAEELVRAFSTYFRVVNLAETVHRVRRLRDHARERPDGQPGGLGDAMAELAGAGVDPPTVASLLERLRIEPVFTAHPTEAHPRRRPTVADEREHVLFYLTDVLYRVVPRFHEAVEEAVVSAWGAEAAPRTSRPLLAFASWVGGDMDGNPNVTAATVTETLERQRLLVLDRYHAEVLRLAELLSQSPRRVGMAPAIHELVERYAELFPEAENRVHLRHREMPYRVLLKLMAARLVATSRDEPRGYGGPEEYRADLETIAASLDAHRGRLAGAAVVRRALVRAEVFGFHLAILDLRQDALVHRRAVGQLLDDPEWLDRPADERAERLRQTLLAGEAPAATANDETQRVLEVFAAVAAGRRRFGETAFGPFIISMTEDVDDLLTVLLLARWGGLGIPGEPLPLDVAPLFETVPDLERAPEVMARLLEDPAYRPHLEARGMSQVVMIGYSDSNKDSGLLASRWNLQRAQAALAATLEAAGAELTIFHGRGGTISRGGGKTHRAVLAAPIGSVRGRLRVTEQGEAIDAKFGLGAIAMRNLERSAGATLLAMAPGRSAPASAERWREEMTRIAGWSRAAYRRLVYETPEFVDYFRAATPIDVIERLKIGSRPASRRGGGGVENLRAIPWVFAWTQSRHLLPGWYGLGTALERAIDELGLEECAAMVRDWPFLATLVEDAEMVLAKADLAIARRYAELAGETGERLFPGLREEFDRTVAALATLTGSEELLAADPTLRRSIRLRNPYVDPMSLLQVDLLARWRKGGRRDPELLEALIATVDGISEGLRNTG